MFPLLAWGCIPVATLLGLTEGLVLSGVILAFKNDHLGWCAGICCPREELPQQRVRQVCRQLKKNPAAMETLYGQGDAGLVWYRTIRSQLTLQPSQLLARGGAPSATLGAIGT